MKVETRRGAVVKLLLRDGWALVRHGGDHDVYRHPERGFVAVPRHRALSPGVARSIAARAGWSED